MRFFRGSLARLRLLLAPRSAESRMTEEIRFHVEMETDRLRAAGLDDHEARRRALLAFGGVEKTKEELREGRDLAWLAGLGLDLRVGARMLRKYPVLTLASTLALAVAIALAASWFQFMSNIVHPTLPLPDGDRVVSLRNRDLQTAAVEPRSLHDFATWREELELVEELSAASPVEYAATNETGGVASVQGMRVTASLFRLAGVSPLLGRHLTEADEAPGAELVAVLGHDAWQTLFEGDPKAIGRTVRLGAEHATLVGVMPAGFGFPVNEEIWLPLQVQGQSYQPRGGPQISMHGRLARGADLDAARAELELLGKQASTAFPATHEHLRPEIERYGRSSDMSAPAALLNLPFLFFLVVVCANVATLLFARMATRSGEIAMRSALGASRRRILVQLIAESLVLTSLAAVLGLLAAHGGLRWGMDLFWEVQQSKPPFWFHFGLSAPTVIYVCLLAGLGATIIGGLPALRVTRRPLRQRLPVPGADGGGQRFGAIATTVIVAQVALCVIFVPLAIRRGQELLAWRGDTDFPAKSFLTARLTRQAEEASPASAAADADAAEAAPETVATAPAERQADSFAAAHRRLEALPGVLAATRVDRLPGINHPVRAVHFDDDSALVLEVRSLAVDPNYFEVVGARVASGRSFGEADVTGEARVVVVDDAWARETFTGGGAVGRRLRYGGRNDDEIRWYEIVGTVSAVDRAFGPGKAVAVFHPLRAAERSAVQVYLRTAATPAALAPQIPDLVAAVDPALGVMNVAPLDEVWRPIERSDVFFTIALAVVGAIILLFALIGIYALLSFTVARRAREIGIRTALGADARQIVVSIFARALTQVGLGVVAGAAVVSLTVARDPAGLRLVAMVATAMVVVGLLGCVVPALRALRIEPTTALRAE